MVQKDHEGVRADLYLASHYKFLSRPQWQRKIAGNMVRVNGKAVKSSYRIQFADRIDLYRPESSEPVVNREVQKLFEDDHVMAIFKPSGLPMHESGPFRIVTFENEIAQKFGPEWSAVHRIDRETSGIVLCSNRSDIREKLSRQFMERKIKKEYLLISHGIPEEKMFEVDQPIGDPIDSQIRIKKWVSENGLPAQTIFETIGISFDKKKALIRAFPKTGRTNQIRVHAAWSGFPLVGDKLYHPDESIFLQYAEHGDHEELHLATGFKRCCLHAARIGFTHPLSKIWTEVECPLPEDMADLWLNYLYGIR